MLKEIFYDLGGYNIIIFHFLNHIGNIGYLPYILKSLSVVFQIENFAILYIVICCYQYRLLRKLHNSEQRTEVFDKTFYALFQAGICYAFFGFTYAMLKFSVNLPRPYCSLPEGSFETIMHMKHARCLSSFPSSHVGLALMTTILSWQYLGKIWRYVSVIAKILVAFSRVALAMHYPTDIIYSICITLLSIGVSQLIFSIFSDNLIRSMGERIKRWVV